MRALYCFIAMSLACIANQIAYAGDINRKLITEFDPIAPASASYEESEMGVTTSKWGVLADFNLAGVMSTGPELWTGTFTATGPEDDATHYRREDLWPGERHKLDAIRLRWNVTGWEMPSSMRGWYIKMGYSYTRINSRANRYNEDGGEGDALPVITTQNSPGDDTDLITDIRHGVAAGFGNRWLFFDQKITVNLGASVTANFKRAVSVDSKDPDALADYEHIIADLPDTRMHTRPMPEANLGIGYAW